MILLNGNKDALLRDEANVRRRYGHRYAGTSWRRNVMLRIYDGEPFVRLGLARPGKGPNYMLATSCARIEP